MTVSHIRCAFDDCGWLNALCCVIAQINRDQAVHGLRPSVQGEIPLAQKCNKVVSPARFSADAPSLVVIRLSVITDHAVSQAFVMCHCMAAHVVWWAC